jgi:CheY-like chemotaxis protein
MTLPVIICDDSALARKQIARALPVDWDIDLGFATNGQEAIEAIQQGRSDVLFLDLNMPVMNGYEVLDLIREYDLPTLVLVVSGDVQEEARRRVMSKGALDFIRKPVSSDEIMQILIRYGVFQSGSGNHALLPPSREQQAVTSFLEGLQEVVNVAMGQAGSHMSDLLQTFIQLPVPDVFVCSYGDLTDKLRFTLNDDCMAEKFTGVSHGFSGNGVAGEGIFLVKGDEFPRLHTLMRDDLPEQINASSGILSDLSELLVGSCLKGISQQLGIEFNHSYPALLGTQQSLSVLLGNNHKQDDILAVSISYHLSSPDIDCYLLLLFTADSLERIRLRVQLLDTELTELKP